LISKLYTNSESSKRNNSKKSKKSQTKKSKKSSKKKNRKNKTVENDKLKTKKNDVIETPVLLKKKNKDFNSEEEITFSDFNSEEKDSKKEKQSNVSEENSFNSILNELLQTKKVHIENMIQKNNNNVNKSRNLKNQKPTIVNMFPANDKITLPGDFVPLTERTEDRSHIQYIETRSNKTSKNQSLNKIYNFDAGSIMSNQEADKYKKVLKYKTLSDNPKYVYIETNKKNKNKKIHKSNLFVNLKHVSKNEIK